MNEYDSIVNELLLDIFDKILVTEEKALSKGNFSDLSKIGRASCRERV